MSTASAVALWTGVLLLGLYHGLNPAMGWPLAVAQAMEGGRTRALWRAWLPLAAGHLLAMLLVLLPFAALSGLFAWVGRGRGLGLAAGGVVLALGLWQLLAPHRHRWLARVRPTQLLLWSFLMASVHGAALMLLPVYIGLCTRLPTEALAATAGLDLTLRAALALTVALAHSLAMLASGLLLGWLVYRHLGPGLLRSAWFNLDRLWALALCVAGAAALATAR